MKRNILPVEVSWVTKPKGRSPWVYSNNLHLVDYIIKLTGHSEIPFENVNM